MDKIDIEMRLVELDELIAGESTSEQFLAYCEEFDTLTEQLEELA